MPRQRVSTGSKLTGAQWVFRATASGCPIGRQNLARHDTRHYDLIMLDPPSFSNSKGERDFDVQADHETLLELAMARLSSEGVLYFSIIVAVLSCLRASRRGGVSRT